MLDIDPSLMLFMLIAILVLIFTLNRILFSPLVSFMDQRDSSIKSELEASKSIGLDSDDLKAKAEQIIEDAKHEAQSIRQKAIEETKTLAMSKIVDKQKKLDKDYKAFITKLAKENESLKSSLLEQIPLFKETIKTKLAKL